MKGDFSRDTFDENKQYCSVLMQQGRVQVDADWNEQQAINRNLSETVNRDIIGLCGVPADAPGFSISEYDGLGNFKIGQGRIYVDGIIVELQRSLFYTEQLHMPEIDGEHLLVSEFPEGQTAEQALVYLDVWRRHVTALDDPDIRETALGGPDTATRLQTIAQVKVKKLSKKANRGTISCESALLEWEEIISPSMGTMAARVSPTVSDPDPCILPAGSGYSGLENQLYRVEIHQKGPLETATFKWSRDNGSVVVGVESLSGSEVIVSSLGPDDVLGIHANDWVELLDERHELRNVPGYMFRIVSANPSTRVVQLDGTVLSADIDTNRKLRLRRWDSNGEQTVKIPPENEGWINLENGIEIKFSGSDYRTGDYWLIPARTATRNIEGSTDSQFKSPHGIKHHYCRLALIQSNGKVQDCRHFFDPLTSHVQAIHISDTNWNNDSHMTSDDFVRKGLKVEFDQPVDPLLPQLWGIGSSPISTPFRPTAASFIVKLELPVNLSKPASVPNVDLNPWPPIFEEFILDGVMAFEDQDSAIHWWPFELVKSGSKQIEDKILALNNFLQNSQPLRVRVFIKGNAIWNTNNSRRIYLDGRALGRAPLAMQANSRVDLAFPSGIGIRTSDFESWFYLVKSVTLLGIILNPIEIHFGNEEQDDQQINIIGEVSISSASPAGGVEVLLSIDAAFISIPASVFIAEGANGATFELIAMAPKQFRRSIVQRTSNVTVTASLNSIQKTAQLEVDWDWIIPPP